MLALVAVPIVLLGACSPWAVRLATPDVDHSGRTAGRLYAISTAGSLVGTMSAALLFIPFIGTQRTFLVFALTLGLVAAAGLGWRYLAVPAAVAAVIAVPVGTVKAKTDPGERVIYETETRLQYARVVEEPDGTRKLELNEGVAEHSLYRPGSYLTGNYWDGLVVDPVREPHPGALTGGDPRQRRRHRGPRVRPLLPGDADRRRRDRPGAGRDRAPLLRHARPAPQRSTTRTPAPGCGTRPGTTT